MNDKSKIIILGDSISQGIGRKKINYSKRLQEKIGKDYEILNLAHTGTTIYYALDKIDEINKFSPDVIIIMYGNVDAQIRPNINGNRYNISNIIPKRYKMNGMLDPRPFYSRKWYRKVPDKLDNMARFIIRNIVTKTQGVCQWVPLNEFIDKYQELLNRINTDNTKIFLVSTIKLDEKYYPSCTEEYKIYNKSIKSLAQKNNCQYIDLFNYIDKLLNTYEWNDIFYFDHYHPNDKGYELIAELLYRSIVNAGGENE